MDHADRLGAPVFRNAVRPFLTLYEKEKEHLMSAKTILASGFLLLGGALLLLVSSLDYSDFYSLFGLLFTLAGAVPLLIHLGSRYLTWYHKSPHHPQMRDNKEDPHENS